MVLSQKVNTVYVSAHIFVTQFANVLELIIYEYLGSDFS